MTPSTPLAAQRPPRTKPRHRTHAALFAAAAAALALGACTTVVQPRPMVRERVVYQPAPAQLRPMPAPVREDRGQPPDPGFNWVAGHWTWQGNAWAWTHGRWVAQPVPPMPALIVEQITVAPSPQHYWVPGHWVWRAETGGWAWIGGTWRQ